MTKEPIREIGIKRAVGAKRREFIFQFVFESVLLAAVGGLVGLVIAFTIIKLIWMIPANDGAMQFLGRPLLSSSVVLTAIVILNVIGLLAGLFPTRKAAKVDPVEALRYE